MVSRTVVIEDKYGVHMRPAMRICEEAQKYGASIYLKVRHVQANAKSVLGLLAARVRQGDEIEVICDGADEEEALEAVIDVIQSEQ